jgi:hypothetical protein
MRALTAVGLGLLVGVAGGLRSAPTPLPHANAEEVGIMTAISPVARSTSRAMQRRERRNQRRGAKQHPKGVRLCKKEEHKLAETLRAYRACRTDSDCRLLIRPCGPYQTCGQPVNKGGLSPVKAAIGEFAGQCASGAPACVECPERGTKCEAGFCRVFPPVICTQEVRICADGSPVSRNPDYDCQFDPCSTIAPSGSPEASTP